MSMADALIVDDAIRVVRFFIRQITRAVRFYLYVKPQIEARIIRELRTFN